MRSEKTIEGKGRRKPSPIRKKKGRKAPKPLADLDSGTWGGRLKKALKGTARPEWLTAHLHTLLQNKNNRTGRKPTLH